MLEILENGVGYVKLTYPDLSVRVFRTTLNSSILLSYGSVLEKGYLFDIDRKMQVPYNTLCKLEISVDKPILKGVDEFANRFI